MTGVHLKHSVISSFVDDPAATKFQTPTPFSLEDIDAFRCHTKRLNWTTEDVLKQLKETGNGDDGNDVGAAERYLSTVKMVFRVENEKLEEKLPFSTALAIAGMFYYPLFSAVHARINISHSNTNCIHTQVPIFVLLMQLLRPNCPS